MTAAAIVLVILFMWSLLLAAYGRRLAADWREPVLACPVLIVESDDWGPGPPADASRLRQLAGVLESVRDSLGHPAVCTLGVVLAAPAPTGAQRAGGEPRYKRRVLDAAEFAPVRDAMLAGERAGVFALQLHGMEHYWPPAVQRAADLDRSVRSFLQPEQGVPRHESLPSHLQARWVDASRLPSSPLSEGDIEQAVAEETASFARVLGAPAQVAVPVTFTWTSGVEKAWASRGISTVITPGTRNIGRDGQGRLVSDGSDLRNGDIGASGVTYLVRDVYFEPVLGHTAEGTLPAIRQRCDAGRPVLIEMHRFNFTGDDAQAERSLDELRRLLRAAVAELPGLRFMTSSALAQALRGRDPAVVDSRFAARFRAFVRRAGSEGRLRKLAWVSGLAVVASALLAVATLASRRTAP